MRHEKSIKWLLNYNYTAQKNIDKIMSDLFVFRCQKYRIGKLIFYAGGEYKILHHQFFDGNTLQNSLFNKKVACFFFHKKSRRIGNRRTKDFLFE